MSGLTHSTVSSDSYDVSPPSRWHRIKWALFGWFIMWPHRRRTKKLLYLLEKAKEK